MPNIGKEKAVKFYALSILLASTITLIGIWFGATASGDSILLTINEYNEKYPELIMWAIAVPCISYLLITWLDDES